MSAGNESIPPPSSLDRASEALLDWVAAETTRARARLDSLAAGTNITSQIKDRQQKNGPQRITSIGGEWLAGICSRRSDGRPVAWLAQLDDESLEIEELYAGHSYERGGVHYDWRPYSAVLSPDAAYCAIISNLGHRGPDRLHILDCHTREFLEVDELLLPRGPVLWTHDSVGFFYRPNSAVDYYDVRSQQRRMLTYSCPPKTRFDLTADRRLLIRAMECGLDGNQVEIIDTGTPPHHLFKRIQQAEGSWLNLQSDHGDLFLLTNEDHPRFQLWRAPVESPNDRTLLIPGSDALMRPPKLAKDSLVVHKLVQGLSRLEVYDRQGQLRGEVPLPPCSYILNMFSEPDCSTVLISLGSLAMPAHHFRLDTETLELTLFGSPAGAELDSSEFDLRQDWGTSADGTRIPYLLLRSKRFQKEPRPLILHGYGGFRSPEHVWFDPTVIPWVEAGGCYVQAIPRGTSMLGVDWYRPSVKSGKQKVIEDVIACAEHLVDQGQTTPAQLGLLGESNGGLIMSAAAIQRPELFGAVVCQAPLTDLLNIHKYAGRNGYWPHEYGDPEDPDDAAFMAKLSPFHNVQDGVAYPAMLFMSSDGDPIIPPIHAWKMAARVQQATSSNRPVMLLNDQRQEYSSDLSSEGSLQKVVDTYTFFAWQLGLTPFPKEAD